jgi:hypothetical protein
MLTAASNMARKPLPHMRRSSMVRTGLLGADSSQRSET